MKTEAYDLMRDLAASHWWYRARCEVICSLVEKHVPRGSSIIDYGGGTGYIARRLGDLGFTVRVADMSREMLDECAASGLQVIDLNAGKLSPDSADCVLALDVLEHLDDEVEVLRQLRSSLRPGGTLIATVPAYEFLWSGEDFVSNHLRRHTRGSFLKNIRSGGFTVVWSSYFNTILFPLIAGVILAKRILRPRDMYCSNVTETPSWQNALFYHLFALERPMLQSVSFPFGVSIAAVAKNA
jgi:2-polyprenyl-3-methyl-5-hydroxy-6-metoxy-1,4-benzoquinol methylase